MVINISVQYNGGFLPDPSLLPLGNPVKYHVPGSGFVFIAHIIVYYYYHV